MDMDRTPQRTHPSSTSTQSSYTSSNHINTVTQSPSRHQNQLNQAQTQIFTENLGGLPMVIDASSWKKGKSAQEPPDPRQTRQLGADRERMKDMMADSFSRNETISILPGFKESRTIAKPCIKLAASNSFSHRNGVKAERPAAGLPPHGWKQQEFQNQQRQLQQQYYQQPQQPPSQSRPEKMQPPSTKVHEIRSDRGAGGDNDQTPWPYSKCQKSQRAIREAQAAYKRDLDRQIEEKRMSQKGNPNSRTGPAGGKSAKDSKTPRPINQSVSLEAFRNTGFLPSWFDPIRNNPLYATSQSDCKQDPNVPTMCEEEGQVMEASSEQNQQGASRAEVHSNSEGPCAVDYQPSQMAYAPNPQNVGNLDGNYYIVSQEILNQLNQGSLQLQNLSMFPGAPYSPSPSSQNLAPSQSHSRQQVPGPTSDNLTAGPPKSQHPNNYNPAQPHPQVSNSNTQPTAGMQSIHISQIQQHQQNNPQFHPQQPPQQNIWTPWLSSNNFSLNLRNLPPPPTPPPEDSQSNHITPRAENPHPGPHNHENIRQFHETCRQNENGRHPQENVHNNPENSRHNQEAVTEGLPMLAPSNHSDDHGSVQQTESTTILSKGEEVHDCIESAVDGIEREDPFFDNSEHCVDRTGEDPRATAMPHVSQTSSQRPNEEEMRLRYKSELAKQIEEKKRMEQEKAAKLEEEEARMQRKVEEDQKRMVEEYEKEQNLEKIKQEEYKKRQEIIAKEIERVDRATEAEKERKKLERRKSQAALLILRRSEENLEETKPPQSYESPVDLTVCAASKWKPTERLKSPVKSESSDEQISDTHSPRPRTVVISQHRPIIESPRLNAPLSEPLPSTSANSFDNEKLQNDVSFLATVRQALRDEDTRIGNIIKKKERFFVTI